MSRYTNITKSLLRFRIQNEKAYVGNFWAELASTTLFIITFIAFSSLLFAKIGNFGGYTKNDFLFMTLIGQASFYTWALIMYPAFSQLIANVRTGSFDFMLLKPISTRFYVYAAAFRPIYALFVTIPNILILIWVIDWSQIALSISSVLLGLIVWVSGMLILNTLMLILASPVFTQGDATDMLNSTYALFSITQMPYNLLPPIMKFLGFITIPTLLATAGGGYVMLQKGPSALLIFSSLIAGAVVVVIYRLLWIKCINSYSSASS
jgi:ABC-2 type transport system permease protein